MGDQERELPEGQPEEAPAPRSQTTDGRVRFTKEKDAPREGFERVVPWRGGMERR